MWEVFLFVNPLGSYCLKTEESILNFVENNNIQAHFNFIAITNIDNINDIMTRKNLDIHDIKSRNEITLASYDAAMSFKAASCQGQKRARKFMMGLQYAINKLELDYNADLVKKIAEESKIDISELLADKDCDLVKNSFEADQLLAQEMGVTKTPSTVIFDYDSEDQSGLLINDSLCKDNLDNVLLELKSSQSIKKNIVKNSANKVIDLSFYQK